MLRSFTRPAARITRELQDAGLVASNVEPPLTPIYAGVEQFPVRDGRAPSPPDA
ncbi:MAG: hypothetical protein ACRDT0_19315 [Pseudonocardiaceae bacterium]